MSNLGAGMLFSAICMVFSLSANAFDLNGAWTTDEFELRQGVREKKQ